MAKTNLTTDQILGFIQLRIKDLRNSYKLYKEELINDGIKEDKIGSMVFYNNIDEYLHGMNDAYSSYCELEFLYEILTDDKERGFYDINSEDRKKFGLEKF